MKSKNAGLRIAGTIFGLVAVIHLLRLISGITVLIGDCSLPIWINIIGFIGTALLCTWLWKLSFT
jgi:hypothetical protein